MSNSIKYVDIHGHLNFHDYDNDREEAIKRAHDSGVAMITVGANIESSKKAVELAEAHENMWAAVGIHPTEIQRSDLRDTLVKVEPLRDHAINELSLLATHPKVVAIGECGLDYFHSSPEDVGLQREVFERHIELANKVNKPLMLHIRNVKNGGNAYQEAVQMLKKSAKVRANFHFFAGTVGDLKNILDIDCTVSFTGVLTFTRDYDELVKYAPLDRIMSETDCPFVAPVPYRGKRNEPVHVIEVVKAIARIRGEDEGVVAKQLLLNAQRFFFGR